MMLRTQGPRNRAMEGFGRRGGKGGLPESRGGGGRAGGRGWFWAASICVLTHPSQTHPISPVRV